MSPPSCDSPVEWETLLAYRLGELDAGSEARIEQRYLGCAVCSGRLEQLAAWTQGVRALAGQSGLDVVVSDPFVRRLAERGIHVREYRVPPNGSVNCTVAPGGDFVVARLEASLDDVERVDLVTVASEREMRQEDIPFVGASGCVVWSPRIAALRALPAISLHIRLLAVDRDGKRILGEYTFNHTPYAGPDAG